MSSSAPPALVIVGPTSHGVVEYANDLAAAVANRSPGAVILRFPDAAALDRFDGDATDRLHVHVTDGLFGRDLDEAAEAVERLTAAHSVAVTLHDLPQASDGARNLPRRAAAYTRFLAGAVGVSVSSRHEASLLAEHVTTSLVPEILPLGTRVAHPAAVRIGVEDAGSERLEILMAGYVYPGKGHEEVLAAAATLVGQGAGPVRVTVLGGVAARHADEANRLQLAAAEAGVEWRITGYLDRDDYARGLSSPGVPVLAHRHYSASRTLLDWTEAGRRALVVTTRYTREMADLRPGTLTLVDGARESLADAIAMLGRDEGATILDACTSLAPTLDDVARASLDWWDGLAW
jgi:glycosyltransferase involved in cell wall biosynthesis